MPPPDILQGNFKPDYYLKHIQKDLRLAISMGDMANHPTPMAAAANEVQLQAFIIFLGLHFAFCVLIFYYLILFLCIEKVLQQCNGVFLFFSYCELVTKKLPACSQ